MAIFDSVLAWKGMVAEYVVIAPPAVANTTAKVTKAYTSVCRGTPPGPVMLPLLQIRMSPHEDAKARCIGGLTPSSDANS